MDRFRKPAEGVIPLGSSNLPLSAFRVACVWGGDRRPAAGRMLSGWRNMPKLTAEMPLLNEPPDFSLAVGGPLYQLWRRTRLAGDAMQLVSRRIVVLVGLAWIPLLILSVAEGHAWGASVPIPFLYDLETHARFLLTLPLLIIAELVVHQRMRPVVQQFVERGLISESIRPRFDAAIASAMRLRNSIVIEVLLIATVYAIGVGLVWRTQVALDVASWYGSGMRGVLQPTLAGWWMGLVSLPVFQFLLLRWYFRIMIWTRFLWQVSRLELSLFPSHPDRCGGLGFLSQLCYAFSPLMFAQGTLLAGLIANRIFFTGASLPQFKVPMAALAAVLVAVVFGPLLVFAPRLAEAKRAGLREFGALSQRYVREFEGKWLRTGAPEAESPLGSADIQSLADLGNSFQVVQGMRLAPIDLQSVLRLVIVSLLPLLPLTLTMISFEQLLDHMLKLVF